jgi:hypothetical protein
MGRSFRLSPAPLPRPDIGSGAMHTNVNRTPGPRQSRAKPRAWPARQT